MAAIGITLKKSANNHDTTTRCHNPQSANAHGTTTARWHNSQKGRGHIVILII